MTKFIQRELNVLTPEQVKLQYETAGIGSRAGAHFIDCMLLTAFFVLIFTALVQSTTLFAGGIVATAKEFAGAAAILLFFAIIVSYFVLTEFYMGGKTFGKKWVGIRVIQDNGQALTMLSSLIRNFFRIIDMLPLGYSIGILVSFFHAKDKRIGDLLAGTVVVMDGSTNRPKQQLQLDRKRNKRLVKMSRGEGVSPYDLVLTEFQKVKLNREDWQLLATFMERIPTLTDKKLSEISLQVADHFLRKMVIEEADLYLKQPISFLIALHGELQEEWRFD